MKHKRILLLVSAVTFGSFLLLTTSASLASAVRCGSNVIKTGDKKRTVLQKCGPPTYEEGNRNIWVYVYERKRFTLELQFSSRGNLQFIRHDRSF